MLFDMNHKFTGISRQNFFRVFFFSNCQILTKTPKAWESWMLISWSHKLIDFAASYSLHPWCVSECACMDLCLRMCVPPIFTTLVVWFSIILFFKFSRKTATNALRAWIQFQMVLWAHTHTYARTHTDGASHHSIKITKEGTGDSIAVAVAYGECAAIVTRASGSCVVVVRVRVHVRVRTVSGVFSACVPLERACWCACRASMCECVYVHQTYCHPIRLHCMAQWYVMRFVSFVERLDPVSSFEFFLLLRHTHIALLHSNTNRISSALTVSECRRSHSISIRKIIVNLVASNISHIYISLYI